MNKIVLAILGVLMVLGVGYWLLSGPSAASNQPMVGQEQATTTGAAVPVTDATASTTNTTTSNSNKKNMTATLHTNMGDITVEFFPDQAPNTVANFIKLAKSGFYDGTKFHRVIKGFMDQGGDPLSKDDSMVARWGTGGPGYQFNDEIAAQNENAPGTIAMANSGPNTQGSQFFINAVDNRTNLGNNYTVFGKVTSGMDVVTAINNVQTGQSDRPLKPVVLTSVTLSS
ncbi:MAG: peptidylprolyl isomerase [bacterium]